MFSATSLYKVGLIANAWTITCRDIGVFNDFLYGVRKENSVGSGCCSREINFRKNGCSWYGRKVSKSNEGLCRWILLSKTERQQTA